MVRKVRPGSLVSLENLIYRKDMVLIFAFDSDGKLISYSRKVYLTFF